MRKLITAVFCSILFSSLAKAQFTKASLQATGLTCALCSNAINKSLKKLSFVTDVQSDIKNSAFAITFKNDNAFDIDEIKKAVEDAGFSVGALSLTANFENIGVEKDKHIQIGKSVFHFLNSKEQVLSGEKTIAIVDKGFLPAKQFKKIAGSSKMGCVSTGKAAGNCCEKDGIKDGTRIYHVTI